MVDYNGDGQTNEEYIREHLDEYGVQEDTVDSLLETRRAVETEIWVVNDGDGVIRVGDNVYGADEIDQALEDPQITQELQSETTYDGETPPPDYRTGLAFGELTEVGAEIYESIKGSEEDTLGKGKKV